MTIRRTGRPPRFRNYQDFKSYLRADFGHRCAYCTIPEARWGSERNFVVEHFRPKSKFPKLRVAYRNLYYACNVCNEAKGDRWPDPRLRRRGFRFFDACKDERAAHFAELPNGFLRPLTPCAHWTIANCRLNRALLVDWRRERRELLADIDAADDAIAELRARRACSPTLVALLDAHAALTKRLRTFY